MFCSFKPSLFYYIEHSIVILNECMVGVREMSRRARTEGFVV